MTRSNVPRHFSTIASLALLLGPLAACGGGAPDLEGVYQVTSHTENTTDCQTEGADVNEYPYFSLRNDEFFGEPLLAFGQCTGPDMSECQDSGLFSSFLDVDGEWVQVISSSTFGSSCSLGYFEGVIIENEGGSLRIEYRSYNEDDPTLTNEECTAEEAEARGTSMPCTRYEVLEGQPAS